MIAGGEKKVGVRGISKMHAKWSPYSIVIIKTACKDAALSARHSSLDPGHPVKLVFTLSQQCRRLQDYLISAVSILPKHI